MCAVRNVLFIMCDQLRRDFVSCYGASPVPTPNLDRLAATGVRFDNAYVQSGVCGPSRMSYYTGRYVSSHGATWNRVPLSAAEPTLGDYLREAGRGAALAGKTHVLPDTEALARFGIEVESERGALLREGGFRVIDRYDGHRPPGPESGYAAFLRARGYDSADPWSDYVIGVDDGGRIASGWQLRNVHLPSRVAEPHSETAYMTDLALDWIRAQGEKPWVLHLSYVKPHWPYVAPAPFHAMFRAAAVGPMLHGPQDGTADEHPVVRAYREHDECVSFAREAVARHVLGRGVRDCRAFMARTAEWKYVHWEGFRPQLFDLSRDPREFDDLGADPRHDAIRARMRERLFDWLATLKRRATVTDRDVEQRTDAHRADGIHIGIW